VSLNTRYRSYCHGDLAIGTSIIRDTQIGERLGRKSSFKNCLPNTQNHSPEGTSLAYTYDVLDLAVEGLLQAPGPELRRHGSHPTATMRPAICKPSAIRTRCKPRTCFGPAEPPEADLRGNQRSGVLGGDEAVRAGIVFTYNLTGTRATMVDASGTTNYSSYDNRDRLKSQSHAGRHDELWLRRPRPLLTITSSEH